MGNFIANVKYYTSTIFGNIRVFFYDLLQKFPFIMYLIAFIAAVGVFVAIFTLAKHFDEIQAERKRKLEEAKKRPREDTKWDIKMRERQTGFFSYRRIDVLMTSTGYKYKQKAKNKLVQLPSEYMQDCFVIAIIGGIIFVGVAWALTEFTFKPVQLIWFIPGFFIFLRFNDWSLTSNDKTDNKKMLPDINSMYETLKVSATAGIPIIDGLAECYRQVKHPRLKTAMSEVSNSIHAGRDIETAINNLRAQFTSPEIIQFCIVIRQALETGRQEEILSDLAANMREVQNEINHQLEESLNTKVQMIQMGLLFLLIFTMLYATFTTLTAQFGAM